MTTTPDTSPETAAPDKRRRATLLTAIVVVVLAVAAVGGWLLFGGSKAETTGARTVAQIKDSGKVRIGVFSDKAPFGSVDSSGTYVGYDIEYAKRVAKDLGVTLELVPVEAAARVEFLTSGKVDIILANFTVTDERAQKVDFAKPYLKVSLGVVSPDDAPVTDIAQLDGKDVLVVRGTTAETYLEANHPEVKIQKYEQYTEVTNALLDGRGAAWVTDNTEALAWAKNNDGFSTSIASLGPQDTIAAAVQKGNTDLRTWLDDQLVTLGTENFFHAAYTTTLEPVYGTDVSADELVVEGGVVR
ncbi:cysteine ABC transporter substrate-binding protein [Sanguibacter massiliensis]|uniref:cysteine ABC transporter substrate-binding protein n=1 Tax=Sanguibacter massiliensis TaxID=1973217 RepID=UPI000C8614DB|nr:cysteine ABC transporter substrate-binding protein [Sanguibacter massiliensis]